jgi:hypothetical protein
VFAYSTIFAHLVVSRLNVHSGLVANATGVTLDDVRPVDSFPVITI